MGIPGLAKVNGSGGVNQLETPARCVIRTILSAPSEQEATQEVFRAIKVAFGELEVQPGRVAVKAPSIYAEIGYGQIQTPGTK